jgi:hypothetical protein
MSGQASHRICNVAFAHIVALTPPSSVPSEDVLISEDCAGPADVHPLPAVSSSGLLSLCTKAQVVPFSRGLAAAFPPPFPHPFVIV